MAGWERTATEDAPVWEMEFPHRPGLVVRCTVPSLRCEVLAAKVAPLLAAGLDREHRALLALAEAFAEDSLLGWNVAWNGVPVPATADGIGRVDRALVAEILHTWIPLWLPQPEPEPDPGLDAELAALSVDITDSPPEGDDTAEAGLVMAGA